MKLLLIGLLCIGIVHGGFSGVTLTMDLKDYGIADPDDGSCPSTGSGYFIDRAFDMTCFGRQVSCADGVYQGSFYTCDDNQVYTADGNFNCYSTDSDTVRDSCEVQVICNQDSIGILVDEGAIWSQTEADIQFGNENCRISYDSSNTQYEQTYSLLDSSWSDCGVTRSLGSDPSGGDGYYIRYDFTVKRYTWRNAIEINGTSDRVEERHDGVVVTREKCFMVDATCYYNADGTVSSSFVPSSANTLTQSDTSALTFELVPVVCATDNSGADQSEQVVYVTDELCFRAGIVTDWHDDIRMQIRQCYATESGGDGSVYPLGNRSSTAQYETDSTFDWDCYETGDAYSEFFRFDAFRFQESTMGEMNDETTYVQSIDITCDVVACEIDDYSSDDCFTDCRYSATRKRREASQHIMGKYLRDTVKTRTYVLPKRASLFESDSFKYNNMFSMLMFGSGCILAMVVVGLLVTLHKMKKEVKYGVLPQDSAKA